MVQINSPVPFFPRFPALRHRNVLIGTVWVITMLFVSIGGILINEYEGKESFIGAD